jgi:two-component system, sensor histidine kinase and response regulator
MIEQIDSSPTVPFDAAALLERVEGDAELLREIVDLFATDSPRLLKELRQASADGNAGILKRAAHTLKGAASNFGAIAVVDAARDLETMGREGNLADAPAVCGRLEESLRVFEDGLARFVASLPAA